MNNQETCLRGSDLKFPDNRCAHELFEAQVARRPYAVALEFGPVKLSYTELNERANRLAHYLLRLGVGPDELVGICVERSVEMVVGLLGVLKAGGAYVPLDPAYPSERLRFMVEDAQVSLLLTKQHLQNQVPSGHVQVICLDTQWAEISEESADNLTVQARPDDLAYVIYTSGSTGKPKGVLLQHRGLCNMIPATIRAYDVREDSRLLQFASFSFDAATNEIFTVLSAGGTLCLASKDELMPGPSLIRLLRDLQITNVTLPPSALAVLSADEEFPHLRNIVSAGESCSVELVRRWSRGRRFVNAYGPTEATVCASVAVYTDGECQKVTIGQPIDNTQLYVLDDQLQPVARGVEGELHIGGVGLARGYLNRPELTAEKFIRHPFSDDPEERLYKTGDLVRVLPDGDLEFLGRIDHQVKIRGFRIELGEIEALLLQHESVREAVAMAREDVPGKKQLVAYVAGHEAAESPMAGELRRYLQERLPDYMVPAAFVVLERFPLTPNGKVDRQAMPVPELNRGGVECEFVAARTPLEEALVSIWQEVMGVEQLGVHDPFLDLGGHSLMAVQILARVRERLQIDLPLQQLFTSPTVAQMAEKIEAVRHQGQAVRMGSIPRVPRTDDAPLSFAQERVWFVHKMNPENRAYAAQAMMRFRGNLQVGVLEQTLSAIVERHEMFRTTFHEVEGRPVQRIHEPFEVRLPVVSLLDVSALEREAKLQQLMLEEMVRPFDMAQLPLVRWMLFQISEAEHVLLHIEHHMVHDGWSYNVFLREFAALYQAFSQGELSPLPEMPIQFADYTSWQREWINGEQAEEQIAYWKETLAGCQTVLELPTDHPRPATPSYQGASLRIELPVERTDALHAMSRREGTTLFVTLLAAFNVLLYRYTGQEDVLVGSGVANRRLHDVEGLIGMIVNNIVLRNQVAADLSFRELLAQVRETAYGAFSHDDLPFDKVVEAVNPVRVASRNPLVQVMFSFHDSPMPRLDLPDVAVEIKEALSNGSAKFDLNVVGIPHPVPRRSEVAGDEVWVGMSMIFEYSSDLFEKATVERLVEHYRMLLAGILADPGQTVAQLSLLSPAEQQQLLVEWNETATDYPRQSTIHSLFEAQAAQTPHAVAVQAEDRCLTYQELNRQANQVAHYLKTCGVQAEQGVGLFVKRSLEMLVALLGILKAGAAYVPLDPSYPQERLSFMLEDAQVSVLLTQSDLVSQLPPHQAQVICLDADEDLIARESEENVGEQTTAEQLAYVIYTSGSTGRPKGVCVPHRAVVRLVKETNYLKFTEEDVFLQFANVSFDAATFEIWGSLLNGARLVLFPAHEPSLEELGQVIAKHGVNTLFLTTGLFHQMAEGQLDALKPVRTLLAGGDVMSAPHAKRVLEAWNGTLINAYGPTENATFSTCYAMTDPAQVGNRVSIGRPIANTQLYVLDPHLQPVPVGVPGELYVGGDGLALGYLNRPELTAEKFIPHPFSEQPGAKLYRTGDLVRYLADGNLEFLGRIDNQVKIRGFRIELGEIENRLSSHPFVKETIVRVWEPNVGDKRLVAYVVPQQEDAVNASDLRQFLKEHLPEFMVPSVFLFLEMLPLNRNGKVDVRALPHPDRDDYTADVVYVAPRTPLEYALVKIWEETLHVERIGIYDHFFEIGGHSMMAIQLLSRVRQTLGIGLPMHRLFESPRIADLARALEDIQKAERSGSQQHHAAELRRLHRSTSPLSYDQEELWNVEQSEPGYPIYNVVGALTIDGPLRVEQLERSLHELIKRHEMLRTRFMVQDGQPQMVIEPEWPVNLNVIDLSALSEEEQREQVMQVKRTMGLEPFDLSAQPPLRLALLRLAEEEHQLVIVRHHIITDSWSNEVFHRDLDVLYTAFVKGEPSPLPELPIQYADFVHWQREFLQGDVLERLLNYWQEQLAGAETELALPTDHPRPPRRTYRGAKYSLQLPTDLVQRVETFCKGENLTTNMVLLAAFKMVLARFSGQEDILIGTPIVNRDRAEMADLIGYLIGVMILRTQLSGNPSLRELLGRVRETALGAYAHKDLPVELLMQHLNLETDPSRNPLYQVMFVYYASLEEQKTEGQSLQLCTEMVDFGYSEFELMMVIGNLGEQIVARLEYNTDLFELSTIKWLAKQYEAFLEQIVSDPEQHLMELPLLPKTVDSMVSSSR